MKSTLLNNDFNIIAYRGGTEEKPENSVAAILHSLRYSPDAIIEIDLQRTKENNVIAFHDFDLERTSNGKGKVCHFTVEELQTLNLKNADGTLNSLCKIATLDEIFKTFKGQRFILDIHENNPTLIKKVIAIVESHEQQSNIAIQSIHDVIIDQFRLLKPTWTFIAGTKETKRFIYASKLRMERWVKLKSDIIFLPEKLGKMKILTTRALNELHRRKIKVWTCKNFDPYENVNSYDEIKRIKGLEVDGIYTDNPEKLIEVQSPLSAIC
ncbi:glycerophosphodiester phosphodiesterase family protein [Pedobacter sp.]|jgi:glycerophosphoryl diester phosphodiesterase|uniref:glycerophosphodiester phosphodiesterase family protein n=1 Tax=Pedobacter sp. TaxID=1411316 RepID=UPI002C71530E|nr:glycerophosphodiester phosphodiesterase family protein [Pedobacter sp.]HWW41307.1 glycerophosphodiester phosphodiesterase family protein [Pedobacter sp.]